MGSAQKCWEECPGADGMRDNSILPSQHFSHELGLLVSLAGAPTGVLAVQCPQLPHAMLVVKLIRRMLNSEPQRPVVQGAGWRRKYLEPGDEWRWNRRSGAGEQNWHPVQTPPTLIALPVCFNHIKACHNHSFRFLSLSKQRFH